MTRHDIILKWMAYLLALLATAVVNYYVLGPLPISLPLLLPILAVAGGTLEGSSFGAVYGCACGAVMSSLGHMGPGCVASLALFGWLAGLTAQYLLRRDVWGHFLCSAAALFCWELWEVGHRLLARSAPPEALLRVALPELGWSLVLILPVYWVGRFCCVHYGRIYHE